MLDVWRGPLQDQILEIRHWESTPTGPAHYIATRHAVVADHRNSTAALWNAEGTDADGWRLTDTFRYSPNGVVDHLDNRGDPTCEDGGLGETCRPDWMPFLFGAQYHTPTTGLVYMRNRWYAPHFRQFLTPDPAGFPTTYNPYAYVGFDPINRWDPFGLKGSSFGNSPYRIRLGPDGPVDDFAEGMGKTAVNTPWDLWNVGTTGFCYFGPCRPENLRLRPPFQIRNRMERYGSWAMLTIEVGTAGIGLFRLAKRFPKLFDEIPSLYRAGGKSADDVAAGRKFDDLEIDSKQFGEKWKRHAQDYGASAGNDAARQRYLERIKQTFNNPDEIRKGPFNPGAGGGTNYRFYRKGQDVVIVDESGNFVSMFPGNEMGWFKRAEIVSE